MTKQDPPDKPNYAQAVREYDAFMARTRGRSLTVAETKYLADLRHRMNLGANAEREPC